MPTIVVIPADSAASAIAALDRWTCESTMPAVAISPSPGTIAVWESTTRSTPDCTSGFPARPVPDDAAVGDPDRRLAHAEEGVEDEDVRDDHVERAVPPGHALPGGAGGRPPASDRAHQDAVARGLAAPADELVAGRHVVGLHLHPQVRVGQPHPVARVGPYRAA